MKHKHKWQFVTIYTESPLAYPSSKRVATFICDCGFLKKVTVRSIHE